MLQKVPSAGYDLGVRHYREKSSLLYEMSVSLCVSKCVRYLSLLSFFVILITQD